MDVKLLKYKIQIYYLKNWIIEFSLINYKLFNLIIN